MRSALHAALIDNHNKRHEWLILFQCWVDILTTTIINWLKNLMIQVMFDIMETFEQKKMLWNSCKTIEGKQDNVQINMVWQNLCLLLIHRKMYMQSFQ